MTARKPKKNVRQRGGHTHGWGSKKKHRGAGHRGGRGNAGTGKKGDVKKPSNIRLGITFGKHGFKKKNARIIKAITLKDIQQKIDKIVNNKKAENKAGTYTLDVKKLGFNKVLGNGKFTLKAKITSDYFSKSAIEKINKAGGEAIISLKEVKKPKADSNKKENKKKEKSAEEDKKDAASDEESS